MSLRIRHYDFSIRNNAFDNVSINTLFIQNLIPLVKRQELSVLASQQVSVQHHLAGTLLSRVLGPRHWDGLHCLGDVSDARLVVALLSDQETHLVGSG